MEINFKQRGVGNLRKLVVVDDNNIPTGEIKLVRVEEAEDNVLEEGSPISKELLETINWRDEDIVFKNLDSNELKEALADKTQIVATLDGRVWIIPSLSSGEEPFSLDTNASPSVSSVLDEDDSGYKTGLMVENGQLKTIDAGIAERDYSDNKYYGNKGVVTVVGENGLIVENGVIRLNEATESEGGAISSNYYGKLKRFIDGVEVSDMNLATSNGLYYGNSVTNAPTINPITALVVKNGNNITQAVIDQETNKAWVRVIKNGVFGNWHSSDKEEDVLYEGELILNNMDIPNTASLYERGYRRVRIEVYLKDIMDDEDYMTYTYEQYGNVEMKLFEYNGVDNLYNYGTILTSIRGGDIKYITVTNIMDGSIKLKSYTLNASSGAISTLNKTYYVKIIGYKK